MDRTRWILFGLIIIAAVSWLVFTSKGNSTDVSNVNPATIRREGATADHILGNPNAKVVLFEYGDFACPGCGNAHAPLKVLVEKYKDHIAFVYRDLPLTTIHPNALAASSAAEAAGKQGKYWEMHDLLFANGQQDTWESLSPETRTQAFEQFATELGLNMEQYRADVQSPEVAENISADRALAKKVGATSTPSFYINDQKAGSSVSELEAKIIDALKQAGVSVPNSAEPQN